MVYIVFLLSIMGVCFGIQLSYAACPEWVRTAQGQIAEFEYQDTIEASDYKNFIEICVYKIPGSGGTYYVYQLFGAGYQFVPTEILYCGITKRDVRERALEHSRRGSAYKPKFHRMIAIGKYSDADTAKAQAHACICTYGPS